MLTQFKTIYRQSETVMEQGFIKDILLLLFVLGLNQSNIYVFTK